MSKQYKIRYPDIRHCRTTSGLHPVHSAEASSTFSTTHSYCVSKINEFLDVGVHCTWVHCT